ncbi:hypothetical protein AYK26_03455 [Euryarchaeota archaeon SM23-78]|nr:MAG: hypothetical protein AYK26_03455 [Euryarchaeota archaeon SM23-78]MBW3001082.1 radical SAM protein [Candidatus Woesearchaeota archaeon]
MYNPIQLSGAIEKIVSKEDKRKYYRFRPARYYGGISTADCVGCNLRCRYCWSWNVVNNPGKTGKFYSPQEVANKLISIAKKFGYKQLRVSGNEPTLAKHHLLKLISLIPNDYLFILETNGILIGHDNEYAKELSKYKNLHVRVSLKASNKEEFLKLTGAEPEFFDYQLKALENLEKNKVSYHPAVIELAKDINGLRKRLEKINNNLPAELEIEPLIEYPAVMSRLRKLGNKI